MNMVQRAMRLAMIGHHGQTNKFDGEPYILHPHRVAIAVERSGLDEEHIAVAWMHDLLEDTDVTLEQLTAEFPDSVYSAVLCLTKIKGRSNDEYLQQVIRHDVARAVKIHDLEDNFRRNWMVESEEDRLRLAAKYSKALHTLLG